MDSVYNTGLEGGGAELRYNSFDPDVRTAVSTEGDEGMIRRALLSVADKTGLVEFAHGLATEGVELIATGGTARTLREAGLPVTPLEEVTGFPELLGGRVKTLHPAVHAGILAPRTPEGLEALRTHGLAPIDLVAVNLYPFREAVARPDVTVEAAVEEIDIGGVALLRAAAKNHAWVTVVVDPADHEVVLEEIGRFGDTTPETRRRLAWKAFLHTAAYDAAIARYFGRLVDGAFPPQYPLDAHKVLELRYGENPHQRAAAYRTDPGGVLDARILQGKPLSFNNLLDADAAWGAVLRFAEAPAAVIVKHTVPTGIAQAETLAEAYRAALASDPVSAFGGIVALSRPVDAETAAEIKKVFTEVILAPGFSEEARQILAKRRNLRLLELPLADLPPEEVRGIAGGILVQTRDLEDPARWEVVTERAPTPEEEAGLRFAWRAVQPVKSNAIVLARGTATVGIGGGMTSRVEAVRLAVARAGDRARGAVLASDAFFPFPDGVEAAAEAGVTAVVQPGGSIRDGEVIEAANRAGIAMVFTGVRHFRH